MRYNGKKQAHAGQKEVLFMTAQEYRRLLHQIPELDFDLPKTTEFVKQALAGLPCTVTVPAKSAVAAFFDAGKPETFAFRADMDALPVTEAACTAYTSLHKGRMHACGHDAHTAMLLAFAERLAAHPEALLRNVLLLFEPAEETTGGARGICESGILQKHQVTAVFGTHVMPGLASGCIATRAGGMMACSCETDVQFLGKSAHIAKAAEGADAIEAAARFLCAAYDEKAPGGQTQLLKFGQMSGGTVRNALAAQAELKGSLRAMTRPGRDALQQTVRRLAKEAAAKTGCTASVTFNEGYPPVENDPALTARVLQALSERFAIRQAEPEMTAEDFSVYGEYAPSVFFRLGVGSTAPLHAADFDFEDSVLNAMPEFYTALLGI